MQKDTQAKVATRFANADPRVQFSHAGNHDHPAIQRVYFCAEQLFSLHPVHLLRLPYSSGARTASV